MAYINTAAGGEAVLDLYNLDASDVFEETAANVVTVPFMQDITVITQLARLDLKL